MREAKQEVQEEEQSKQEGSEEEGSTREARQGKRLSRFSRSENAPRMQMMERDKQVVMAVWEHRFLRRDQIERLFFTGMSTCNQRLLRLYQHGYLERIFKPVVFGGCQAVYALDKAGAYLVAAETGLDHKVITWRKRKIEAIFMDHTLAVSEFYVNTVLAIRRNPEAKLVFWKRESKELQDRTSDPQGKRKYLTVNPDGFFCIQMGECKAHFFLEVDLGTATLGRFKDKAVAYRQYWKTGQFTEKYGCKGFRVITVAESPRRLQGLERVTREAGGRNMFVFLNANPDSWNQDRPFWI